MTACIITQGLTAPDCSSRFSSPGVAHDDIYIFNYSEIASFTTGAQEGEVSAITFSPSYEVGFKLDIHKNSGQFLEELQVGEESAPFYNQTFSARVIANDTVTRNAIEGFVGVDVVIAAKLKNGKYILLGELAGLKLTEQVKDSGKVAGDSVGDTLVFTGEENGKARFFFDTSEDNTKTVLDGYL